MTKCEGWYCPNTLPGLNVIGVEPYSTAEVDDLQVLLLFVVNDVFWFEVPA
jgi:hypothetical protein